MRLTDRLTAAVARVRIAVHDGMARTTRIAAQAITLSLLAFTQPVLAQPQGCSPPSQLQPVFDLLGAITQVTMMGGLTIAALGIAIGGILFMWPGQDNNRRAKSIITYTVIGMVIILSAHAIVAFVTSQMGTTVCG